MVGRLAALDLADEVLDVAETVRSRKAQDGFAIDLESRLAQVEVSPDDERHGVDNHPEQLARGILVDVLQEPAGTAAVRPNQDLAAVGLYLDRREADIAECAR